MRICASGGTISGKVSALFYLLYKVTIYRGLVRICASPLDSTSDTSRLLRKSSTERLYGGYSRHRDYMEDTVDIETIWRILYSRHRDYMEDIVDIETIWRI